MIVRALGEDPTDVSYLGFGQASPVIIRAIFGAEDVSDNLEGELDLIDQGPTLGLKVGDLPFHITAGPTNTPHDEVIVRGTRYAVIERRLDGEGMADLRLEEMDA